MIYFRCPFCRYLGTGTAPLVPKRPEKRKMGTRLLFSFPNDSEWIPREMIYRTTVALRSGPTETMLMRHPVSASMKAM